MNKIEPVIEKVENGERIDKAEARTLFKDADLLLMADLAHKKRLLLHPEPVVTYVVDRNINYTNVCVSGCRFCAFFCTSDAPHAYVISIEELKEKIEETITLGGTQILLQGGMHPDLTLDYYLDLLSFIKEKFPIHIHGFSPPEIDFIAKKSGLSIEEILKEFITAGLDSIPGGGAEILDDEIRTEISPNKCGSGPWLKVMETAHQLGLKTTATMMFGHIESLDHIIEHLLKIRELQDKTHGFTAFIPWTFQPANTRIEVLPATSAQYLKVLALSRIVLDNVDNIQASWVTQGDKIAQVALVFGANDIGSTMIEENVVAAAGVKFRLPEEQMIKLIADAGFTPVQRDCFYNHIREGKTSRKL
ncbi:cyclic dehypoxanthinyl futalosine synthase [Desulfobacterales bacterium HSG16]|nr:cyclic dehypoxanthinyl futalosine synthase [Desulfobacterales bacterium HSG16]